MPDSCISKATRKSEDNHGGIPLNADGRISSLDGLTGITTIVIAIILHYTMYWIDDPTRLPFYKYIGFLYLYGYLGVELFFIISGFKFTYLYETTIAENKITFREFIKKRIIRLYPLLFVTTILTEILQIQIKMCVGLYFASSSSSLYDMLLCLIGVNTLILPEITTINLPAWTIPLEVGMYTVFFIILKFSRKIKIQLYEASFGALLLGVIIQHRHISSQLIINENFARALINFFVGVLLCKFQEINTKKELTSIICAMICVGSIIVLKQVDSDIIGNLNGYFTFLILPAFFLLSVNSSILIRLFSGKIAKFLSNISYSMYLVHFPLSILISLLYHAYGKTIDSSSVAFFCFRGLSVMIVSFLVYRFVEIPINSFVKGLFMNR